MAKQPVEYLPNRALGRTPPALFVLKVSTAAFFLELLFLSFLYFSKALRVGWGHVALLLAVNIVPALIVSWLGRLFIAYRIYGASFALLFTLIVAAFPATMLSAGVTPVIRALVGFSILGSLLWLGYCGFRQTIDSPFTREIPQGPSGFLDESSGEVDLVAVPVTPNQRRQIVRWGRYAPLAAPIALLATRLTPLRVDLIVLIVLNLVLAAVFAWGFGSTLAYILTIRRWEQKHGMRMRIKRERTPINYEGDIDAREKDKDAKNQ